MYLRLLSTVLLSIITLTVFAALSCTADKEPSAYQDLLSVIPDSGEASSMVWIDDYSLVREIFSVPALPGAGDDDDALNAFYDWLYPLANYELDADAPPTFGFGRSSFFGPFRRMDKPGEAFRYMAFDVRNMNQSVLTGLPTFDVTVGSFNPEANDAALAACDECPPATHNEHRGITYHSWGEDGEGDSDLALAPPVFDTLGRGGSLAVMDRYVFRTLTSRDMKLLIDTHQGEHRSLADLEEFRLLAEGMSRLGAYSMLMSDLTFSMGELREATMDDGQPLSKHQLDQIAKPAPLRPYVSYATGAGHDKDGPYMALVLVHTDGSDAEDNVELLRARIKEGISFFYGTPWGRRC